MKILIAVHHFPPHYTGGAELRALRTANALQARGHGVKVLCVEHVHAGPERGASWVDDVYEGIQVRRLSFNIASAPDRFRWEYDNTWVGQHVQMLLGEVRPDVFHLIGGYLISGRALHVAHDLGIPTVVSLTDFWFLCRRITMLRSDGQVSTLPLNPVTCARCLGEEKRRYRLPGRFVPGLREVFWRFQKPQIRQVVARMDFLRDTLNRACVIVSPSQFLRSVFIQAGVEAERIIFSRQGQDFPGLKLESLAKKPSATLRVGYIGQISPIKGVHLLFEAVRRMPEAPLTVTAYGDISRFPNYVARLRRIAASDRRLTLAGTYGRHEISKVLEDLDVIVMPSLWYENSPNSIQEAFAHRTPVIASDLGGMAELVHHGENGLLFAPREAGSLAQQLRRLLDEPQLWSTLQAGIGPVKSMRQEMDELEAIYRGVVEDLRVSGAGGAAPGMASGQAGSD